jgi:AraC-like DNA-binding protein
MFADIIYSFGIILTTLIAVFLGIKNIQNQRFSVMILVIFFLTNAFCHAFYIFIKYGFILQFAFLYKVPAPITFLLAPLSFIYVRSVLFNERKFKWYDIFHLTPFVIFFTNYWSFYFIDLTTKKELIKAVVADFSLTFKRQDGLLPEYANVLTRIILSFTYLVWQWQIILKFFKTNQSLNSQFIKTKKWLYNFTLAQSVYLILNLLMSILLQKTIESQGIKDILANISILLAAISFVFIILYLIWDTQLLAGLHQLKIDEKHVIKAKDHLKLDWQKASAILIEERSFLNDNYSVEMVAQTLGVERKDVLMFIQNNGMKSFQDLVNHLKVEYSLILIKEGHLDKYCMDALAIASGFNHKSSYYRNFKKFKNITPLQVAAEVTL